MKVKRESEVAQSSLSLSDPMDCSLPGSSIHGIFQDGDGQGGLACCDSWGRKESDMTEQLHFDFSLYALEKKMATHSSILAWRIPETGEPGGLSSMGSHRVRHD